MAVTLACALAACAGGGDRSDGDARAAGPTTSSSAAGTGPADDAAATACAETAAALAPLADGLAGGDLESALLDAEMPEREPTGTSQTVDLALARMELELSFAKQAVQLGVFGTEARADLQAAYDGLDDACAGVGSEF